MKQNLLDQMTDAMAQFECKTGKPPVQYEMHPADYNELLQQLEPYVIQITSSHQREVFGVKIVLDNNAPRMKK